MKRNVFGWAAAVAVSLAGVGAASAADMAVKARPVPVPVFSWTGCYIGVSAGGKWARNEDAVVIPTVTGGGLVVPTTAVATTTDADTWLAGGQAGCNVQSGNWVFGVEADAHAQRWDSFYTLRAGVPAPFVAGDQFGIRSDWQASIRGRVGYAMDRTLFYVTGGVAFTEIKSYSNFVPFVGGNLAPITFPGTIAGDRQIAFGGTIGAGLEYAWTNNFTVGVEGRYTWYGTERLAAGPVAVIALPGAAPTFVNSNAYRDIRLETAEVLVKANWKFGAPGAVVAKY